MRFQNTERDFDLEQIYGYACDSALLPMHVLTILPQGHYKAERCVGWLSYPAAPLHCASRVAYSYFVTAEQLALDSSFFPDVGTHPAAYPYLHSVPYPASVHWPPKVRKND